jgi:formylglycine-generating enzyme required for sulfatase activity
MGELEAGVGRTLREGRYTLRGILGQGGQGRTYEAIDHGRNACTVAVKQFDVSGASTWKEVELAEREARMLAKLSHPLLPAYVEHFEENGSLYLVMEKLAGTPLSVVRRRGGLGEPEVWRLLADADCALSYLHGLSPPAIHRDLKPGNVLQRPDGSFGFVDFGAVSERLRPEGRSTVVGTFGFMAPEQFQGRAGPASDVYSIAATAIVLLTGVDAENLPHRGLGIDVQKALENKASPRLRAALERMLETDPDVRPSRIGPLLVPPTTGGAPTAAGAARANRLSRTVTWVGASAAIALLRFAAFGLRATWAPPAPKSDIASAIPTAPPSQPAPQKAPRPPEAMVRLGGGKFVLRNTGEEVVVQPFAMDATEVTAADYKRCVEQGRCTWGGGAGNYLWPGKAQHPMNYVTWDEAVAYCKAQDKRLPSEEEWEWAARGGEQGRKYPWGDDEPKERVCRAGCDGCPVGDFPAGDARGGIHDLAGEEWTATIDSNETMHIVRGWKWKYEKEGGVRDRAAVRDDQRYCGQSIRCVQSTTADGALTSPPPPPPPTHETGPVELTWQGKIATATGAAPPIGTACTLAATVQISPGRGPADELVLMTLKCGGVTLYDSSARLIGMSSTSFSLHEEPAPGAPGGWQYSILHDDTGARSGVRAQISVNTEIGTVEAFRETAPSFRVRVTSAARSSKRTGLPLFPPPKSRPGSP